MDGEKALKEIARVDKYLSKYSYGDIKSLFAIIIVTHQAEGLVKQIIKKNKIKKCA